LDLLITNECAFLSTYGVKESFDNLDHKIIAGKVKSHFVRQISYKRLIHHFSHENLNAKQGSQQCSETSKMN